MPTEKTRVSYGSNFKRAAFYCFSKRNKNPQAKQNRCSVREELIITQPRCSAVVQQWAGHHTCKTSWIIRYPPGNGARLLHSISSNLILKYILISNWIETNDPLYLKNSCQLFMQRNRQYINKLYRSEVNSIDGLVMSVSYFNSCVLIMYRNSHHSIITSACQKKVPCLPGLWQILT